MQALKEMQSTYHKSTTVPGLIFFINHRFAEDMCTLYMNSLMTFLLAHSADVYM